MSAITFQYLRTSLAVRSLHVNDGKCLEFSKKRIDKMHVWILCEIESQEMIVASKIS